MINIQDKLSTRLDGLSSTATREIFKILANKDIISFAGGVPAGDALPLEEIAEITNEILSDSIKGRQAIQYGITEGTPQLREQLVEYAKNFGINNIGVSNLTVISGGQQGLDLAFRAFLDRGDCILVENPTYLSVLMMVKSHGATAIGIKSKNDGLCLKDLEKKIVSTKPKILYVVPTFSNPTGRTYSLENRKAILELCVKYGVVILEDDPYSMLRYEGEHLPSIKSLDTTGQVIYTASFSKTISPGLRMGFSIAKEEVLEKMVFIKQGSDLHTPSLSQMILSEILKRNLVKKTVEKNIPKYKEKRDIMLSAIKKYMPKNFKHTTPQGGLFVWGEFDTSVDTVLKFNEALENKVAYINGTAFFAEKGGRNTLRLNYSAETPERIEQGIRVLGEVFNS
ncbi:MAG: PLP-dependent aminotransferase family protein [Firmicutes bacterium]|nr:PLP-dependent aminotransferase family protein [Bacillota bacterium]